MPEQLPAILPGNWLGSLSYSQGQCASYGGMRYFQYEGYALVDTTTGAAISLRNEADQPCTIPCPADTIALSASQPAYITHASFYLPTIGEMLPFSAKPVVGGVTIGAAQFLKLAFLVGADLTSALVAGAVSPVASGTGLVTGEAPPIINPFSPVGVFASGEIRLFSATAANNTAVTGANIRVSAAQRRLLIPCRVGYVRQMRSPGIGEFDISPAQRDLFDRV